MWLIFYSDIFLVVWYVGACLEHVIG